MNPICREMRKDILRISKVSRQGHIPSCFSVVEILYTLYNTMRHDPKKPSWEERDIFILSKGHASLALYRVLAEFGYFDKKKLDSFGAFMSDYGCHTDRLKVPGIEASTGSLGHGIGIATGIALGLMIKRSDRKVFVLIGDGEANEGAVWEAVMVAVNLRLYNLTIIYDNNMSHERGLQINNPLQHFKGFGCDTSEVDGHDINKIKQELLKTSDTVRAIIANTKKGYGSITLVKKHYEWHRRSPSNLEFEQILEEMGEKSI